MADATDNALIAQRIEKLDRLSNLDGVRYRNDFRVSCSVGEAIARGEPMDGPALETADIRLRLAGRIMAVNSFGKACFVRIRDRSGTIQAYVRQDAVSETAFARLKAADIGDLAGIEGALFRTRTNELTLKATDFFVLSKSLRPLPEKWHGLKDAELRQRMRYVDLIVNEESREVFRMRARIVKYIRDFLDERGFLEVETPMMHTILGGANARPFKTHHNALDMDLYLRIAPELFLKRLVVGGFDRVYEMNRNFRNEGIDTRHNPEFTMIEFYWAYATYLDMMDLTEELLRGMVMALHGRSTVTFKGHEIDFGQPFRRLSVCDGLRQYCGATDETFRDLDAMRRLAQAHGVPRDEAEGIVARHEDGGRGPILALALRVFEERVEKELIQPTFVTDHPSVVSPLSRRKDADPEFADRFELYVACSELANAFSELNDPADQEARFRAQVEAKARGDAEAMEYDEDYIRALEYGLPPTAGEGIGIDRLTMLMTGQESIRDVILFPLLRPER